MDPEQRKIHDSKEKQTEEYSIYRGRVSVAKPNDEKRIDNLITNDNKVRINVESEDERKNMKKAIKENNFIVDKSPVRENTVNLK